MKHRILGALAPLPLVAAAVVGAATPAEAASALQFGRIQYNSPGTDTTSNTSVNGEYAVIKNLTSTTKCLSGWTVRDAAAHTYKFGTFCLGGYKYVNLHTGKGTNTATNRYWGLGYHVWNNGGDKAYLRNSAGTQMDYCAWSTAGSGYVNC